MCACAPRVVDGSTRLNLIYISPYITLDLRRVATWLTISACAERTAVEYASAMGSKQPQWMPHTPPTVTSWTASAGAPAWLGVGLGLGLGVGC